VLLCNSLEYIIMGDVESVKYKQGSTLWRVLNTSNACLWTLRPHLSILGRMWARKHHMAEDAFRTATGFSCTHYLLIYLLTYLLTPCSRYLLEKLTGSQLVKKFHAFYGTRRFLTTFTSTRQMSLSWNRLIQSIPPHPTSWRFIFISSFHIRLGLQRGLFP